MLDISLLPTVNATLNLISFSLLLAGYVLIRSGRRENRFALQTP